MRTRIYTDKRGSKTVKLVVSGQIKIASFLTQRQLKNKNALSVFIRVPKNICAYVCSRDGAREKRRTSKIERPTSDEEQNSGVSRQNPEGWFRYRFSR